MPAIRRSALLCVVSVSLLSLAACRKHASDETFYLISNNLKLPYWQTVNSGFERAATDYQVHARLVGPDTYDSAAELDALRKAVAAHPAGILISAADASSFRGDINDAIQAGIPRHHR